jgi:predicted metal-dependent peptidase
MAIFRTAEEKIKAARTSMILDAPFFGSLLLKMSFVEDNSVPTMATNIYEDSRKIFFNREFVEELQMVELKAVLVHEVLHVAMAHALRRNNRDFVRWNMSGDYAINLIVKDAGFRLPGGKHQGLCDEKYRDMSAEQIYGDIPQPEEDQITVIFDPNGGEEGKDGRGYVVAKIEGHEGCTCGGIREPKGGDGKDLTESEKAALQADLQGMVAEAATMAKAAGKFPGSLEKFVDNILEAKVDWREQLRMFIERITKDDYSWQMPNRRYIGDGIYMASLYSHSIGTIVVGRDTSGSVSDDISEQFASEVSGMLEAVNMENLIDIQCDSRIQAINEFTKDDLPLQVQYKGRGGTYFGPVFDWIEENDIQPTCLIYLTDLYPADEYPDSPDYPVIWVAAEANPQDPPFGDVIRID